MRIHRILCLSVAILLPQIAIAKLPPNQAFGQTEGTLDFCAKTDPDSADRYEEKKKSLVQDVPEKEVTEARKTTEYKEAYDAVGQAFGKIPKDQVIKVCSSLLDEQK